jgi:cytochrome P450
MTTAPATGAAIPLVPGALPVLGHLPRLIRDPVALLTSLPPFGDLVVVRFGRRRVLVVCDPVLAHQVLLDDHVFSKGGPLMDAVRNVEPMGLAVVPDTVHRPLRRLLQPSFHPARMPGYSRIMAQQITAATAAWRDGQILDVVPEMMDITAQVTLAAMFSQTLPKDALHATAEDVNQVVRGMIRQTILRAPWDLLHPAQYRYRRRVARLRRSMVALAAQRRQEGTDYGDLLSALLQPDQAGHRLSDAEVIDQLLTFLLAGVETTAQTVAWAWHEISRHPRIEAQLHAEADTVLAGRPAGHGDLTRLELTGRILTETLRLHSPAWLLTRRTAEDTDLGSHHIPAGTDVLCSPYLSAHQPHTFADPEHFDPGRWEAARAAAIPRNAFIPFGSGPRKCIGDTLGTMEATLILATIAARWRLAALPGTRVRTAPAAILTPRGLRLRAQARL